MTTIEPCCYTKQLKAVFDTLRDRQSVAFATNGDWTLAQFLEWAIWLAPSGELTLALTTVDDSTISMLHTLMERIHTSVSAPSAPLVSMLHLVLPKDECDKPQVQKLSKSYSERITLAHDKLESSMMLLCGNSTTKGVGTVSYTIIGNFNQKIDYRSRFFNVSKDEHLYASYYKWMQSKTRVHRVNG